jgi:hypothetical protein
VKAFDSIEGLEVLTFSKVGEWYEAQVAVDGKLSVPFGFHAGTMESLSDDKALLAFLRRNGEALIEEFGDARYLRYKGTRPDEDANRLMN